MLTRSSIPVWLAFGQLKTMRTSWRWSPLSWIASSLAQARARDAG